MAGSGHRDDASTPSGPPEGVRRRLDDVFCDVLPEITQDEIAGSSDDPQDDPQAARNAEWLRANRPPHHDQG